MESNQRCPGNELNKTLQTYKCDCPSCGKENEIFGDELKKAHKCTECGTALDMSKCKLDGK
jgi:uncharacterized protein (DUF983 family)